jgi:hypothetical protein
MKRKKGNEKICLVNSLLMNIKALVRKVGHLPGFVEKERGLILVSSDRDMLMAHFAMVLTSLECAVGAALLDQEAHSVLVVRDLVSLDVGT